MKTEQKNHLARFEGAVDPDRAYRLDAGGFELSVKEWGAADAPPVAFLHGGFDFARTLDVFAPMIAAAGWRVVAWDQRGHGDSDHVTLYGWDGDMRDAALVIRHASGGRAIPIIGHSKGGSLSVQLVDALPFICSKLVNLDGLPSRRNMPDVAEHERTRMVATDVEAWLDHRRRTAGGERKPAPTAEALAERRRRMNPRLSLEWLIHLAHHGARQDSDGWRWKIDPSMRMGGFGPFRPEWTVMRLVGITVPFLGLLGTEPEPMGWGTQRADVMPFVPPGGRVEMLDGVGHFVHIEAPRRVADLVLEFLGAPA